jgi:hypothetical protein
MRDHSNSPHLERKIALALMIPPEHGGKKKEKGQRKRDNETKADTCLGYRERMREGMLVAE